MRTFQSLVAGLLFLLFSARADADQGTHIQVLDSRFEGDLSNYPTHVIKLQVINPKYFDIRSETELVLSNTSKSYAGKPIIFQNTDRTIVGFGASVARATDKIIVVYISDKGETVINQNFNLEVAAVLKKGIPSAQFDADGLYLDDILGRILRIGFQSDSGKGSFKFEVHLQPDGHLQLVPNSLKFEN
jgi:hypothetical protein